jgi:indolepyruvate ferredoxin oxidoreductase, alpha subunit
MSTKFLMGNEAIGIGALHAGVNLVVGYPGTPSTEVLETVAKYREEVNPEVYVEWSVNEKVALEVAAGASYAGARTLVTMKQVGLNVASDAIMSLAYIGIKGGMVVMVADDPGPISSQTEQDTRSFASFSKLPIFDPVSPEEAYGMIQEAFDYSEKYATPVLFRPTTRVCHGCATVEVMDEIKPHKPEGFIKNSAKWVIFPRLSYQNHLKIEKRNLEISEDFSDSQFNSITVNKKRNCDAVDDNKRRVGVATGGISYVYAMEILDDCVGINSLLKIGTPYPFPEKLALSFLRELDEVLVLEELDPVIERELIYLCGKYHLNVTIKGKISGDTANAGENSVENIAEYLKIILGCQDNNEDLKKAVQIPILPARPPVLCAGCPHRASFFAVKKAMKGKKAVFSGDIGCYTLGNAMPLDMVDTCLCMGAGITIAQGLYRVEPDTVHFAFVGDSTFFASGMTGIVNAVYNQNDIILVVLDNATTAMTGHQVHPGTGKTMMGNIVDKLDIEAILKAFGINSVETVNPLELDKAIEAVEAAVSRKGVKAIIFKSPCIAFVKPAAFFAVNDNSCIHCGKCVKELGCPAIVKTENGGVRIEKSLCYSCGVCTYVCPVGAISQEVM